MFWSVWPIPYTLVGSFASIAYGEPRVTLDINIVLDLQDSQISAFCSAFPAPEFYLSEEAVRDALQARLQFKVWHPASGNKIDFILPRSDEWGQLQLQRRQKLQLLPDCAGFSARPEDVIIGKLCITRRVDRRNISATSRECFESAVMPSTKNIFANGSKNSGMPISGKPSRGR